MNALLNTIGIEIKNEKLYTDAFTHKSYGNENNTANNERLEFLGDAVLELAITESLFKKFPHLPEGELTSLRSALVRKETLANLARELCLGEHIRLSTGEKKGGGAQKDYILANTVEALIGAIYLDRGFGQCKKFLENFLVPRVEQVHKAKSHIGPKTLFQEYAQGKLSQTPTYKLMSETGPDHHKNFVMGAFLGDEKVGTGEGNSKQKAENAAAHNAYIALTEVK